MVSFIGLYRGASLSAAELVAVSADPVLVSHVAGALLHERARDGSGTNDPATVALTGGKRHALELVRDEAQALSGPPGQEGPHRASRGQRAMAGERFGTPLPEAFCARKGCGKPLPPTLRRRGDDRLYCDPRCRARAWRERRAADNRQPKAVSVEVGPQERGRDT